MPLVSASVYVVSDVNTCCWPDEREVWKKSTSKKNWKSPPSRPLGVARTGKTDCIAVVAWILVLYTALCFGNVQSGSSITRSLWTESRWAALKWIKYSTRAHMVTHGVTDLSVRLSLTH